MFYQPKSLKEALEYKAELRETCHLLAGGTDLVVLMNQGKAFPRNLVDLSRIRSLKRVRKSNGKWILSANATFAQCGALPIRCLAEASLSVGGPGIRELGTLAGNLATASPAGDGSTALLALDAELELRSLSRSRRVPISRFFTGYRRTVLAGDEMITRILVPSDYRSYWAKVGMRGAVNISIVAAAVAATPGDEFRIALASVAPSPMRCVKAEEHLASNGLSEESIRTAVTLVRSEIRPISDHRASADYKTHLSGVLVGRLLRRIAG